MGNDPSNWYESSLPLPERKQRGHFSTPPELVEQILDACNYTTEHDLSQLRVLDPSCGSGNFLAAAGNRLFDFAQRNNYDNDALVTIVHRNIWGLDPDPIACFLAEIQLQTLFAAKLAETHQADARLSFPHIHQADGLALAWEEHQPIDLLLANPPYLAAKNIDLSGYGSVRRGQADSYLFFLRLALQIVRPNGWMGLVLPDAFLVRANAAEERRLLLAQTTIHHLWHLAGIFTASVGTVVIIAQKCPASDEHQISWKRERWSQSKSGNEQMVSQALLRNQPGAELRYLLNKAWINLSRSAHFLQSGDLNGGTAASARPAGHGQGGEQSFAPLSSFITIRRGEEIGKSSSLLQKIDPTKNDLSSNYYPVLRGGVDVRSYGCAVAQYGLPRKDIRKPLEWYLAPKILVVKSSGDLQATLDLHGHVVLQTLYMLFLRDDRPLLGEEEGTNGRDKSGPYTAINQEEDDLFFLLAILNSRLLREYVYVMYSAYKWVQPQIEQHILMNLPLPINVTKEEKQQIVQRSRLLTNFVVESKVQCGDLYEEQEQAISALYQAALGRR